MQVAILQKVLHTMIWKQSAITTRRATLVSTLDKYCSWVTEGIDVFHLTSSRVSVEEEREKDGEIILGVPVSIFSAADPKSVAKDAMEGVMELAVGNRPMSRSGATNESTGEGATDLTMLSSALITIFSFRANKPRLQ